MLPGVDDVPARRLHITAHARTDSHGTDAIVERLGMNDDHRRAHERHDLPGHVPGEVKIYHSMEIRQLSEGGALIEIGVPLQLDSLHDFRLSLGDRSVVVQARVVHSHISTVGSDQLDLPHRHRVRRAVRTGHARPSAGSSWRSPPSSVEKP